MPKAVDIRATIAPLPPLQNREPDTPEAEVDAAFAILERTGSTALFAGSFAGESAWERHPNGDELVQVLDGETRLTILTADGPADLEMKAGMVTVVPQGCWHKFRAPSGVTVMTMTPPPTDISAAPEPPKG